MTIACYARKSNDKINDSIENQISIIRSYIKSNKDFLGAEIIQFIDNGFSGIDLNRNAFQELLSKVRMREIDVIVVKDLSRLGRNYLDVCKLTDSIFPFMKVRLISVSENYDSKYRKMNTMDLPTVFQSVLNEYYVMESSKKIRSIFREKTKSGKFMSGVSYGYVLKDRFTPVIDEKKAETVREIFRLCIEGKSTLDIAKILNERKIPSSRNHKWTVDSIRKILQNEQYIGKRISFTHTKDLKTNKHISRDKEYWYINENAFPPIISREVFDKVQKILPKGKNHCSHEKSIMARKLYCAKCGKTLRKYTNFYCKNGYKTGEKPCFQASLKCDVLYKAVLEKVKETIKSEIPEITSKISFSDIVKIESDIALLKEKKSEIFEQLFNNSITQAEFEKQNSDVSSQIDSKQDELKICRKAFALNTKYGSECPLDTLKRLYNSDELTKEHMQFVKRINVFDAEHFEIIMQSDSPLAVLCKNIDIYEEV